MTDEELAKILNEEVTPEQEDVMQAFIHSTIRLADALREARGNGGNFRMLITAIYDLLTSLGEDTPEEIRNSMLQAVGQGLQELGLMPDIHDLSTLAVELATRIKERQQNTKEGGTN